MTVASVNSLLEVSIPATDTPAMAQMAEMTMINRQKILNRATGWGSLLPTASMPFSQRLYALTF